MNIKTNNRVRPLVSYFELTESQRADFDYVTGEDRYSERFFVYKRAAYDSSEFMRLDNCPPWQGSQVDTYFSATLIRFKNDGVIVAYYYC